MTLSNISAVDPNPALAAILKGLERDDRLGQEHVRTLRDYAAGIHPVNLTDRQKAILGHANKNKKFVYSDNHCGLVIEAPVERLHITGVTTQQLARSAQGIVADDHKRVISQLWDWWEINRMDAKQDDVHFSAGRDSVAYIEVDLVREYVGSTQRTRPRYTVQLEYDGTVGVKFHKHPDTG